MLNIRHINCYSRAAINVFSQVCVEYNPVVVGNNRVLESVLLYNDVRHDTICSQPLMLMSGPVHYTVSLTDGSSDFRSSSCAFSSSWLSVTSLNSMCTSLQQHATKHSILLQMSLKEKFSAELFTDDLQHCP